MHRPLIVFALLVGCGGGGDKPIDAAIDVPVDVLIDAPPPPPGHHHYVLDTLLVPTNNNEARDYGQDINGDTTIDNQLGMVIGTLASMGIDAQGTVTHSLSVGSTISLVDLYANDFTTEPAATVAMFVGATPMPGACAGTSDTVCRHHLAGNATFTVPSGSPTNTPLTGALVAGAMTTAPGHLAVPLSVFGSAPVLVTLIGAKIVLGQATDAHIAMMKIGGAITQTEIDTKVIPAMRDGFQAAVAHDCTALTSPPACGCASGTNGKTYLGLFDTSPKDCSISITEVKNNNLINSLLTPDVMVEGVQALSFGVKATAVNAGFVTP